MLTPPVMEGMEVIEQPIYADGYHYDGCDFTPSKGNQLAGLIAQLARTADEIEQSHIVASFR